MKESAGAIAVVVIDKSDEAFLLEQELKNRGASVTLCADLDAAESLHFCNVHAVYINTQVCFSLERIMYFVQNFIAPSVPLFLANITPDDVFLSEYFFRVRSFYPPHQNSYPLIAQEICDAAYEFKRYGDLRRSERIFCVCPMEVFSESGESFHAFSLNVSGAGAFVCAHDTLEFLPFPGELLNFRLHFWELGTCEGSAVVRWLQTDRRKTRGFGIEFAMLSDVSTNRLYAALNALKTRFVAKHVQTQVNLCELLRSFKDFLENYCHIDAYSVQCAPCDVYVHVHSLLLFQVLVKVALTYAQDSSLGAWEIQQAADSNHWLLVFPHVFKSEKLDSRIIAGIQNSGARLVVLPDERVGIKFQQP